MYKYVYWSGYGEQHGASFTYLSNSVPTNARMHVQEMVRSLWMGGGEEREEKEMNIRECE